MIRHKTRASGQFRPLEDRMSKGQLDKRAVKIEARRTVAQSLAREIGLTRAGIIGFVNMGFFSRLRWLLFGPPKGRR